MDKPRSVGFSPGDSNLYRYVKNAPTNATDPSGYADKYGTSRSVNGTPNANTVFDDLKENHNDVRFWLVVFSSGKAEKVVDFKGSNDGHAWIALVDTKTPSMVCKGFFPAENTSPAPANPIVAGAIKDDSQRKFTVARAYPIDSIKFKDVTKRLEILEKEPPDYDLGTNNCTDTAVRLGGLKGVPMIEINAAFAAGRKVLCPPNLAIFMQENAPKGSFWYPIIKKE